MKMVSKYTGGVLMLSIAVGMTPIASEARTVNFACGGNGSLTQTVRSLKPGDVLQVTGTCNENFVVSEEVHRITVNGRGSARVNGPDPLRAAISIRGNGIVLTGFAVTGGEDGIHVGRGGTATIVENIISNVGRHGIGLSQGGNARITNNSVTNSPADGIHVGFGSSARVGFFGFDDGVPVNVGPNTIQNNGRHGILVRGHATAQIIQNAISANTQDGVHVDRVSHALISSNLIDSNGQHGINVQENSGVDLGADSGTDLDDLPNGTTPTALNGQFGINCGSNSYADGRLGTLNGTAGPAAFAGSCVNSLIP